MGPGRKLLLSSFGKGPSGDENEQTLCSLPRQMPSVTADLSQPGEIRTSVCVCVVGWRGGFGVVQYQRECSP